MAIVLDIRENEVNLAVALLCALDRDLSAQNYASRYINIVKPKLIITFIDNYPPFFQIKNKFPEKLIAETTCSLIIFFFL